MRYESPRITDFGSIAQHTFITSSGKPKGGAESCELDPMFGEHSCPGGEGS
jgi:hypothetical protein